MAEEKSSEKKSAAENFGEMLKEFGSAVAEIFNDPELKSKAKDFSESVKESAKVFASRFKDDEVKGKFKDVGKAAHNFGESVSDFFKQEKGKAENSQGPINPEDSKDKNGQGENGDSKKKLDEEPAEDQAVQDKEAENPQNKTTSGTGYASYKKENSKTVLKELDGRFDNYFKSPRAARITGYVFSIIFSLAWMIFINFFNRFIAFYNSETVNGVTTFKIIPVLSSDFRYWLPFFTISIAVSILGNVILIIYERFYLVKIISVITNLFFVAAVGTLLKLFPFDYSQIPVAGLKTAAVPITVAILIIMIVGTSIAIVVDFVKLVVFFARSGSVQD